MPQRRVIVPRLGEVLLTKRRGTKNLRLSITAKGEIRVGLPAWAPYSAGVAFAKRREAWIKGQLVEYSADIITNGARIGRLHRVVFTQTFNQQPASVRLKGNIIEARASLPIESAVVQQKLLAACERALRAEAAELLPQRLDWLAAKHGFTYKDVKVRKLVSRWGSCSRHKNITLSYYLVQLPLELIDYVLLHELNHTKHLHHGPEFWSALERIMPGARVLQKQTRGYKPRVQPF